jgi:hypothetical protein
MKTKNSLGKLKAPTEVRSMRMLGTAKINTDRPRKRARTPRISQAAINHEQQHFQRHPTTKQSRFGFMRWLDRTL